MIKPDIKLAITESIDRNWDAQLDFLRRLVQQPSVRGNTNGVQEIVATELKRLGLDVHEVFVDPNQLSGLPGYSPVDWSYAGLKNIVGTLSAPSSGGRSLVLNGHVDVVSPEPVEFWESGPWEAKITNDRMIGRGTNDMKSGVAAMICALAAIQSCDVDLNGDVLVQSVIDEECSGNGTLACLASGFTAEAAIIPEPFDLSIVSASPGVLWCRIRIRGSGGHASRASEAVNAAEKAFPLIAAIRQLEADQNRPERRHPAFSQIEHPLNFNFGTVHAGDWPSTVPELCTLELRLSCYPGEDLADVKQRVVDCVNSAAARDSWLSQHKPEVAFVGFLAEGAVYDVDSDLTKTLVGNHTEIVGSAPTIRPTTGTIDNRFFQLHYSIPTVCYGPKGGQTHAPNEWVDLQSVLYCTKVLAGTIVDWCGVA